MARSTQSSPELKYIRNLFAPEDEVLRKTRESATLKQGIQIAPEEGKILYLLTKLVKAKRILEIGTLVGYSAIWMARALPPYGKLISIEKSPTHFELAKFNINNSDVADKVELICADAVEFLENNQFQEKFDIVFIDANKASYMAYLQHSENLLRQGGLIIADNTLLFGKVYDDLTQKKPDKMLRIMREFNRALSDPEKYDSIMLPTNEGMVVAIKK